MIPLLFASWFCIPNGSLSTEGAIAVTPERCWNAWTSFGAIDLILFFTAAVAIGLAGAALLNARLPVLPGPVLTVLGGLSFLLVSWRLINPPWDGAGRAAAPFLALLCLAAVAGGGVLSSRFQARRKASRRPGRTGREPVRGRPAGRRPVSGGADPAGPRFNDYNGKG